MNATQKYKLICPVLNGEKTPKQASEEIGIPLSNIYRYLKRFREVNVKLKKHYYGAGKKLGAVNSFV